MKTNSKQHLSILCCVTLCVAMLLGTTINAADAVSSTNKSPKAKMTPAQKTVYNHLTWARVETSKSIKACCKELITEFSTARSKARAYVEHVLGMSSTMKLISGKLSQDDRHTAYLKSKFESMVLSNNALKRAVECVKKKFEEDVSHIEAELLVRLRADVDDFEATKLSIVQQKNLFPQVMIDISKASSLATMEGLQVGIGRNIASFLISEVATKAFLRGALHSTISSKKASTWEEFGTSLIIGFAADVAMSAAYDALADPKGQLTKKIHSQLNKAERAFLMGTTANPGVWPQLIDASNNRSTLRESAVWYLMGFHSKSNKEDSK